MPDTQHRTVQTNGVDMHIAEIISSGTWWAWWRPSARSRR